MSVDRDQRTEKPTEARRKQARESGQVAVSRDLIAATSLFFILVVVREYGLASFDGVREAVRGFLASALSTEALDSERAVEAFTQAGRVVLAVFLPVAGIVTAGTIILSIVQTGWQFRPGQVLPKMERFREEGSDAGILSLRSSGRAAFALLKCAWIGLALTWTLTSLLEPNHVASPARIFELTTVQVARTSFDVLCGAAVMTCLGLVVLGAADWALQRWLLERDLMMTRQEVLEELSQQQAPPHTRQARSRLARRFRKNAQMRTRGGDLE